MSDRPVAELVDAADDQYAVVVLRGELDASTAADARAVVDEALTKEPKDLVFDMSALEFMDSSGIAVLLHAANRLGKVFLRHPKEMVSRVVEITGLADVLVVET
ncbi:MAG: STAS domain-containing protein [Acidimicrobiales bacterium]